MTHSNVPADVFGRYFFISLGLFLSVVTIVFLLIKKKKGNSQLIKEILIRIYSWWAISFIFFVAYNFDRVGFAVVFTLISLFGVHEVFRILRQRMKFRKIIYLIYFLIPLQYYLILNGSAHAYLAFVPIGSFIILPSFSIFLRSSENFLSQVSSIQWCLMMTIYCLSHTVMLSKYNSSVILLLFFLTQLNDVAQFTWGKTFGRRKIIPHMSPNKTWEGLIGGALTLGVVSAFLMPMVLPLSYLESFFVGLFLSPLGFFGDVVLSAVKRDFGVKDYGSSIPGHGGFMDRFDSLTFTAPALYYFLFLIL